MTWRPPRRPEWVMRLNDHAVHVGGPQHLVSLEPDQLLAAAAASVGTDDFGDELDGWRTNFDVFMGAVARECPLHLVGRILTRTDVLRALENRLELVDLWTREPDIVERPVEAPLVIVGAARSGTSILHELLALDRAHLSPTTWKVHHPVAAAGGDPEHIARARQATDAVVRFWHDVQPEYETMHHNHGELPTECIFVTVPTFLSDNWGGTHTVPSYDLHLATADHLPAYRWHRRVLQALQEPDGGRRWVLKAPSHLPTLRQLFAVYPDARVIHIHRDPARTLPSMFDLMGTLKWMRTDHVDIAPIVGPATAGIAGYQHRAIADRADGTLPDGQFFDLRYADLLRDPVAAVHDAYDHFGWSPPAGLAADISSYLAAKPKGAKGSHLYDLATFGLTAGGVHDTFATYMERFAIHPEVPDED